MRTQRHTALTKIDQAVFAGLGMPLACFNKVGLLDVYIPKMAKVDLYLTWTPTSHLAGGRVFKPGPIQTNDIKMVYLSLPSLMDAIKRIGRTRVE